MTILTREDAQIRSDQFPADESDAYRLSDFADYKVMLACMREASLLKQAVAEIRAEYPAEEKQVSVTVLRRIHHGMMAYRELAL